MDPLENCALYHARQISQLSAGRGSATRAEGKAAAYIRQVLQQLGLIDIRVQYFSGLRSIWLFRATAFGLALTGHAAFWLLRRPIGGVLALLVTLVAFSASGYLLWRKASFRSFPLQDNLPHGSSQNVLVVIPSRQEARQRVVLTANLDSQRAVWWYANDLLTRFYLILAPFAVYGLAAAPLLYSLTVLTGWQGFAGLALMPALLHFVAWFTGMTADLGAYSPGANDNASSLGVLLALAGRLSQAPLKATEVWLAFTGCGASGSEGLQNLLAEYESALEQALFVVLSRVGIGDRLAAHLSHRALEGLIRECEQKPGMQLNLTGPLEPFGQGQLLKKRGFASISIQSLRENSDLPPEWHRLTDNAIHLQENALDRAQDLAWSLLQNYTPANKSFSRKPERAGGTERINKS